MMSAAVQIVSEPLKQCETTVSLCLPLGESAKLQATWEKALKCIFFYLKLHNFVLMNTYKNLCTD